MSARPAPSWDTHPFARRTLIRPGTILPAAAARYNAVARQACLVTQQRFEAEVARRVLQVVVEVFAGDLGEGRRSVRRTAAAPRDRGGPGAARPECRSNAGW
ncbi:MAG TPA: hypothetical protein VFY84_13360 [Jiangellales bacterium]|nr:hypothetical protein [Jiangellales bacterium]